MDDELEVREVDQNNIAKFALLAEEMRELEKEVKELDEEKTGLGDVQDEILLTELLRDGEGMFFRYADTYVEMEDEEFTELVDAEKQGITDKLRTKQARLEEIAEEMAVLKRELYTRFKNQIALEFE